MNKLKQSIFLLLLLTIASTSIAQNGFGCQFNTATGEFERPDGSPCINSIITAVPFLRIIPDARSGSLGDAGLATSTDANAMALNSSKLAFAKEDMAVSITYTPWLRSLGLTDVYLAYLAGYKKLNDNEAIGLSLRYFSLGEINFTAEDGTPLRKGKPNEFEVSLSYARKLSEKFSVAVTPKFILSNLAAGLTVNDIDIKAGIAGAADLSVTYDTPLNFTANESNLRIGAAITNLGTKISYSNSINKDYIPANLGIGAAWEMSFNEYNSITIMTDFNKLLVPTPCLDSPESPNNCDESGGPNGANGIPDYKEKSMFGAALSSFGDAPGGFSEELREINFSIGAEYWYAEQFAVRAGYYAEHDTKGGRKFFTVGLGLKYNVFGLNFSYLVPTTNQRNPLDNTLRFSLLFDINNNGDDIE